MRSLGSTFERTVANLFDLIIASYLVPQTFFDSGNELRNTAFVFVVESRDYRYY